MSTMKPCAKCRKLIYAGAAQHLARRCPGEPAGGLREGNRSRPRAARHPTTKRTIMTMTLEPCPFCGGKAKVDHDAWYGWWQTGCTECGCKISEVECYSEADAIAAWNRRTHPSQPAQAVDVGAIREVIKRLEEHPLSDEWKVFDQCADKLTRALSG